MSQQIATIRIENWSQVFELQALKETTLFRGQGADWPLKTSLERQLEASEIRPEHYLHKEYALIREFRRRAHLYLSDLPEEADLVGWLALMQHHGAPTRLLDFTYSFFVACYFAFIDKQDTPVVWAISDLWLRECLFPNNLRYDLLEGLIHTANDKLTHVLREFRGGGTADEELEMLLMIEPTRQIQRLAVQQGLFLMPLNLHSGFVKNLFMTPKHGDEDEAGWVRDTSKHISKIEFSREAARVGLRELHKMNITAESLFPGIDGFASSLRHSVLAT